MTYYEVTMQHNADSLLALSRMQYDLFCTRNRIVRTILSAILVIIGVLNYSAWWGILLLAYGCYLTTSTYVSPDRTAHKLTAQIKQSGKPFPCSRYCFENGGLHIFAMPENKELDPLPYSEVERVGENASYFFIFRDQFGGYMVPKDALGDKVDGFRKFIEEKTGAQWSWDAYFSAMKRFNEETKYELEKWEVNKTAYPQLLGPCYELFRKWNYEMDGGIDPRVMKTCKKVNKLLLQAYERRDEAWVGKMRYRGIVWSCPAHYYANFSNWLANCWGINILVEMESLNFTKPLETEDPELALLDLARLYERMVMRRHTNGGYQNVVDELWRQCEAWNANIIIMYQNVACKNMATVQGILDDQAREQNRKMIWIEHDLMDPRTVSRRQMRDKVSEYMRTVMHAEPLDPTLVDFEDEICL